MIRKASFILSVGMVIVCLFASQNIRSIVPWPELGVLVDISRPTLKSDRKLTIVNMAAVLFILWCLIHLEEFLIPIIVASLLAMLMNPIVGLLQKIKVPEIVASTLAVAILYLPLIGLGSLLIIEGDSLVKSWPQIYATSKTFIGNFSSFSIFGFSPAHYISLEQIQEKVSGEAGASAVILLAALKSAMSAGTSALLILSFAAVILYSKNHLKKSVDRILSVEENPRAAKTLENALSVVQSFLVARAIIVLAVGVADFIILELFGVSYAVILAVLLGLSTLIPVVGFFIGIIPPLILALVSGLSLLTTAIMGACIFAVSSAQDHVLTPVLIGKKLNLNFLATFFALYAGEHAWGLWGMFLSIPILGLARVLLSSTSKLEPWAKLLEEEDSKEPVQIKLKTDEIAGSTT